MGKPAAATAPVLIMTSLMNCRSAACIAHKCQNNAKTISHVGPVLETYQARLNCWEYFLSASGNSSLCNLIQTCHDHMTATHSRLTVHVAVTGIANNIMLVCFKLGVVAVAIAALVCQLGCRYV